MKFSLLDYIDDPALHRYLSVRWNWLAAFAAVVLFTVTWPILGEVTPIPAYLLPVFAACGCAGIATVFAGEIPVRNGWATTAVTAAVASVIGTVDPWPIPIPLFLALLVMTMAALWTQPLRYLPVVTVATAGVFVLGIEPDARIGWIFAVVVVAMTVAFLRYRSRSQRDLAEQSEEAEVLRAREAVLAERTRIARDLHDIVAHRMSMVVVMAQTAPYRLAGAEPPEPVGEGASAEFQAIADAARESLDEVRQLLGVLRPQSDDTDPALAPVQGLDDVAALLDGMRAVGAEVDLNDTSDHAAVPATVGTAVFRIVQESVTNATRHAPGARVSVSIQRDPTRDDLLAVDVLNAPSDREPETLAGSGFGIIGMTERALAVGGTLTAAPQPHGGFAVRASLPITPSPVS